MTNDSLIAGEHLHIVAEMMSNTASYTDATTFLKLLAEDGQIKPNATIGDLNALFEHVFYEYAHDAEANRF